MAGVLIVPDPGAGVPTADATSNVYQRDVVGNKADAAQQTVGTTRSLMAYVKALLTNYTTTLATNLATTNTRVDTTVSSRIGAVNSIQYGTINVNNVTSNTATITSVNTSRSIVLFMGLVSGSTADAKSSNIRLVLTNGTTVTATCNTALATDNIVGFCVVEFAA